MSVFPHLTIGQDVLSLSSVFVAQRIVSFVTIMAPVLHHDQHARNHCPPTGANLASTAANSITNHLPLAEPPQSAFGRDAPFRFVPVLPPTVLQIHNTDSAQATMGHLPPSHEAGADILRELMTRTSLPGAGYSADSIPGQVFYPDYFNRCLLPQPSRGYQLGVVVGSSHQAPFQISSSLYELHYQQNTSFTIPRPTPRLISTYPNMTEDDWQAAINLFSISRQGAVSPVIDVETCSLDEPLATSASSTIPVSEQSTVIEAADNDTSFSSPMSPQGATSSNEDAREFTSPAESNTQTVMNSPNTENASVQARADLKALCRELITCGHVNKLTKIRCEKQFNDQQRFKTHSLRHKSKDEEKYRCDFCLKSFVQRSSLNTHLRIHSGAKPYKCSHCEQSFSDSSTQKKHSRTHTGEKPYPCRFKCGKNFSQSGNRIRHELTIHRSI